MLLFSCDIWKTPKPGVCICGIAWVNKVQEAGMSYMTLNPSKPCTMTSKGNF